MVLPAQLWGVVACAAAGATVFADSPCLRTHPRLLVAAVAMFFAGVIDTLLETLLPDGARRTTWVLDWAFWGHGFFAVILMHSARLAASSPGHIRIKRRSEGIFFITVLAGSELARLIAFRERSVSLVTMTHDLFFLLVALIVYAAMPPARAARSRSSGVLLFLPSCLCALGVLTLFVHKDEPSGVGLIFHDILGWTFVSLALITLANAVVHEACSADATASFVSRHIHCFGWLVVGLWLLVMALLFYLRVNDSSSLPGSDGRIDLVGFASRARSFDDTMAAQAMGGLLAGTLVSASLVVCALSRCGAMEAEHEAEVVDSKAHPLM